MLRSETFPGAEKGALQRLLLAVHNLAAGKPFSGADPPETYHTIQARKRELHQKFMHETGRWLFDTTKVAGLKMKIAPGDCNLITINFPNIMTISHTHLKCYTYETRGVEEKASMKRH